MSTLICDAKQLKRLAALSSSIDTVTNVIYFENDDSVGDSNDSSNVNNWTVSSFSKIEQLGKNNSIQPRLPVKKDIAVIMYTSGSTGLPKVWLTFHIVFSTRMLPFFPFLYCIYHPYFAHFIVHVDKNEVMEDTGY